MDSLTFLYKTIPGRFFLKLLAARPVSKICGAFLDSQLSYFLIKDFATINILLAVVANKSDLEEEGDEG